MINPATWILGVDIGGTFTDAVALRCGDGAVMTAKVQSRRTDPHGSLHAALDALGLTFDDVHVLVHGTTLVTNAVVENRLADVALIATEGFADVLAIGRQNRLHLYRLDLAPKLPAMVPECRRLELRERLAPDGSVLTAPDAAAMDALVEKVVRSGATAAAVSLLHAYANPIHELAVGERLRRRLPYVSLSHRVNPEEREYERTSATVINASVMPLVGDYLDRLESELPATTQLRLFHSAGGMVSSRVVRERPIALALSGPAAGVAAAGRISTRLDLGDVITFDMGGTTTDVCLVCGGCPEIRRHAVLAGRPLRQPMIAVETIGAGGGSIAALDQGVLRVGPRSAGADPGPVGFGRGGSAPTVTDANLVLGYLEDGQTLGDGIHLCRDLAEAALAALGKTMGFSAIETALGILRVANATMVRALRKATVERGIDGRRCTLLTFGGAGPMHAVALARDFGIREVIVPALSSAFSALGCATAELSFAQQQTVRIASRAFDSERLRQVRTALIQDLTANIQPSESDRHALLVEDVALVRYVGQSYSVEVPYRAPADSEDLGRNFRVLHEQLYGFATDEPWEIEAIRVRVSLAVPPPEANLAKARGGDPARPRDEVRCWFTSEKSIPTLRFARAEIISGQTIDGPAIVADRWSTVVLPPGARAVADAEGHLRLDVGEAQ